MDSWVGKIRWRRDRLPTPVFLGFPGGSAAQESACNGRDLGSIPGLGRSCGEGTGHPLQYSGLENPMDCRESCRDLDTPEQLSLHFSLIQLTRVEVGRSIILYRFSLYIELSHCITSIMQKIV